MPTVFDIETVVDPNLWQPPEDEPDKFPPVIASRPIVISCLEINDEHVPVRLGSISGTFSGVVHPSKAVDRIEMQVLEKWAGYLKSRRISLVSWNGRRFDLPVLLGRCFARGIQHPNPLERGSYGYRYDTEMHADLMDMLAVYGAARPSSLDITARAIGLPGKSFEDGNNVQRLFAAGQYEHICTYCETDAFQTAGIYLRWLFTVGVLDRGAYRERAEALIELGRQRLPQEFLEGIDRQAFLLLPRESLGSSQPGIEPRPDIGGVMSAAKPEINETMVHRILPEPEPPRCPGCGSPDSCPRCGCPECPRRDRCSRCEVPPYI